jgi:hypothetical protein
MERSWVVLTTLGWLAGCGAEDIPAAGARGADGSSGQSSLVRLDDEPAGPRCEHGGTAVHVGLDDDGDGVLGASEIDTTSYVCHPAPADPQLVQVVPEPPGANCANGGSAIQIGVDADGDGVLSASEISSTTYVCNGHDPSPPNGVLEGSYLVSNSLDVAFLEGVTSITGDLLVHAPGLSALDLPALTAVGGKLEIQDCDALGKLALGALTQIGGDLRIVANAGTFTSLAGLAKLTSLGGKLDVYNNAALVDLAGLEGLTALPEGAYVVSNPALTGLGGLANVKTAGGDIQIQQNGPVANAWFGALETVAGDLDLRNTVAPMVGAPKLTSIGGTLRLYDHEELTTLSGFAALGSVAGSIQIHECPSLGSATLPALATAGSVQFWNDAALASLSLPELTSTKRLSLGNLPKLASLAAPKLASLAEEGLYLAGLDALTSLAGLAAITSIGGGVNINNNALLEGVAFPLLTTLSVGGSAFQVLSNPSLTTVDLGTVTSYAFGQTVVTGNPVHTFKLGGLGALVSDLSYSAYSLVNGSNQLVVSSTVPLKTVELPHLASLGGSLSVYGSVMTSLALPSLASVTGDVSIQQNGALAKLEVPVLAYVGATNKNALFVKNNPALPEGCVSDLVAQLMSKGFTGPVTASGNGSGPCPP